MSGDDRFIRTSYHIVDPGFAYMFDFKTIKGDLRKALASPNQIVLTRSTAEKLFGHDDPIGKPVSLVNEHIDFTVAAVAEDPPKNSTLQFEALIPWMNAPEWLDIDQSGNWYNTFMEGYVETAPGTSKEQLEEKLVAFKDTHFLEERRATWDVALLPMADEHFRLTKNKQMIAILGIIAAAILLISCINFTSLSVAQTLKRTKEIGLRKVLGSLRSQVTVQFISEAMITCSISISLGLGITWLMLPVVNSYYDFGVTLNLQNNQSLILFLLGVCLATGLLASIAPSLGLAGIKPVNAIKGTIRGTKSGEYLRRTLIVIQFTASIVLLIGTVVVWQQTRYMKSQDLKFNNNNVVAFDTWPELFRDSEKAKQGLLSMRNELLEETAIESASFTSGIPGEYNENYNGYKYTDSTGDTWISLRKIYVNDAFFKTFGMHVVMGRDFSGEIEGDKQGVIINETAMKELGWNDIDNKELEGGGGDGRVHVIGVVQDYYYQSLKRSIQPLAHFYEPRSINRLAVRLNQDRIQEGLALIGAQWDALGPYEPFDYHFVDKTFDTLYKEQDRLGATSSLFSLIALIIAGLGLFSITAYSVRLRRKEVGIRKVLGASVSGIVVKLSKNYGIMIGVGFVLACPTVYYLARTFLEGFAYHIDLSPFLFIGAGISVFILAMMIVGLISGRAALENPVHALKEE